LENGLIFQIGLFKLLQEKEKSKVLSEIVAKIKLERLPLTSPA